MGSLLITPFSCTHKPTLQINMKVFATLTTLLGASTATQHFQNQLHGSNNMRMDQHSMNSLMKPSMGMSMERQMSQQGMSDRRMDINHQMRDMYRDNQDMSSNMMHRNMMGQQMGRNMMGQEMGRNMMGQEMRSNMRDEHRQTQAFGPNQYFVKDDFGNYVYSYNDQQSEKSEQNNGKVTKGHYAYIMSNGVKRRVDYIADDNGFHIIQDNADPARIKRSSEPSLVQTQMISVMDSSLRDDARDMYRMSNMMGLDMPSQMDSNMMGKDQQRYSNMMVGRNMMGRDSMNGQMMGQESMGRRMMGQNAMRRNMMGRNIYNIMSNRGSDMLMGQQMKSNMMGRDMDVMGRNMMGRDMTMDVMESNMMDQDRSSQMMGRSMMGHQDMIRNQMSSDLMNSNNGQHMLQRMEIESVPET